MRPIVLVIGAALVASGCVASNMADYVRALGQDQATVCLKLTLSTPWGTQTTNGARTGITNGTVSCPQDGGMVVRSGGAVETVQPVTVPVQIAPQGLTPLK